MTKRERMILEKKNIAPKTADEKALSDALASATELPAATAADDGKVVKADGGKYVLGEGGGAPFEVVGTFGQNESNKMTITLNKTAAECYEAFKKSPACLMTVPMSDSMTITICFSACVVETNSNGNKTYSMYIYTDKFYKNSSLAADDPVVVTEV